MRIPSFAGYAIAMFLVPCAQAAEMKSNDGQVLLPAQNLTVQLDTGLVTKHGFSDQCLETVARSSGNVLVASRSPGDDLPTVLLNGQIRNLEPDGNGIARMGGIRLAPDGSLFHLQTWKTGSKQTDLLLDGRVIKSWQRGTSIKLLRATDNSLFLLEKEKGKPSRLEKYERTAEGLSNGLPETLLDFRGCAIDRLRLASKSVWSQMTCAGNGTNGIYRLPLRAPTIGRPLVDIESAEFASLPKGTKKPGGVSVLVATGSPAALNFYYAVTGVLLSQTGEVRACASDAEGLQSWNQSYRLRALSLLYSKTGVPAFAALARKSMRLTLASRLNAGVDDVPSCGWTSKIYSDQSDGGLQLMINQAVIANALSTGCFALGDECPKHIQDEILKTRMCLANTFEPDYDTEVQAYRISDDTGFRFAGKIAPWNWQISFASLLKGLPSDIWKRRSESLVNGFLEEWSSDANGSLWRYWPNAYYVEKDLTVQQISEERHEDTGHAGISLMSLAQFEVSKSPEIRASLNDRTAFLLSFGKETPRDMDGDGPKDPRWFLSGGWADFATPELTETYSVPVPSRTSADAVYAYARLFDPAAEFKLDLKIYSCDQECSIEQTLSFESWDKFLKSNPFFQITGASIDTDGAQADNRAVNQLKSVVQ